MDENRKTSAPDDGEIIDGLRRRDSRITRDYFYGYCRIAYSIYNKRYGLTGKPGLDFYSIAHEYYIALSLRDFRQLEDRSPSFSLKSWMVNGFRYVLLDRLKAWRREFTVGDIVSRASDGEIGFTDVPDDSFAADFRRSLSELCDVVTARNQRQGRIMRMLCIEGFKGKEVAARLGITPAAVSQQFHKVMDTIVVPYFRSPEGAALKRGCNAPVAERAGDTGLLAPNMDYGEAFESAMRGAVGAAPPLFAQHAAPRRRGSRVTPERVYSLAPGEVFVFGSSLAGIHGGGASLTACKLFGAEPGNGDGPQGRSYAIPTILGGVDAIRPYVGRFIDYARRHGGETFLVTQIGCGVAGFYPGDIAPLFSAAVDVENVHLPRSFWESLGYSAE